MSWTRLITNKTTEISKLPKYINTKTIKQKSLSYPQKTNQNDPKGSLKYVKFTFVYLLNNFDTGHKEENNPLTISHKTNIKQQIFWVLDNTKFSKIQLRHFELKLSIINSFNATIFYEETQLRTFKIDQYIHPPHLFDSRTPQLCTNCTVR